MLSNCYAEHINTLRRVYDRALENHQIDKLIVYSGNIKKRFQDDLPYPFFANVQFKALVPLVNAPNSWIVWRLSKKPLLLLYQPDDYWHMAPKLGDLFWTPHFDIKTIRAPEEAKQHFGRTDHCAYLGEKNELIDSWVLGQHNPESLIAELSWYRSYKTPYEQACIATANCISAVGHLAAREAFYNGASELEIALTFQRACQQSEDVLAYPSIVGINQHASILHYWGRDPISLPPEERYSLLIDAAASCNGYAADISRTYSYEKNLFSDLVVAMDEVQKNLVNKHKIGKRYFDIGILAQKQMAQLLKNFGIIFIEPEICVETGVINYFMPHSLGHPLGLQVHDVGANQADVKGTILGRNPKYPKVDMMRPIEPNQVVTVEPGIYFIDRLLKELYAGKHLKAINWKLIEQLKVYGGIRIEDNILITQEGPVNFTRQAFEKAQYK